MRSGDMGGFFSAAKVRAEGWSLRLGFGLMMLALTACGTAAARPAALPPHRVEAVSGHAFQAAEDWADRGVLLDSGIRDLSFRNVPGDRLQRHPALRHVPALACRPAWLPAVRKIPASEDPDIPGNLHCGIVLHRILPMRAGPAC